MRNFKHILSAAALVLLSTPAFADLAADKATVDKIVKENIAKESKLHTDESKLYGDAADHFADDGEIGPHAIQHLRPHRVHPPARHDLVED